MSALKGRSKRTRIARQRSTLLLFHCFVFWILALMPASAHFLLNLNVRIFHVEHLADGVSIYMRMPMPYLVANLVGPIGKDGLPKPAPYTTNRREEGKLVHYVDVDQLRRDAKGLGAFAARGLRLFVRGERVNATVEKLRAHRVGKQPNFATLDEAKAAFSAGQSRLDKAGQVYVGDTVIDIILRYKTGSAIYEYAVSSTLDPGLPGQDQTANLILDYSPNGTKIFRARGLLEDPIAISRSALSAIATFIKEGVRHILEGWDHVLFVLCLVLGATKLRSLVWRATGFTIGHSITLIAGFFGFVPSGAWFVPSVEMGIALSIIYVAYVAILFHPQNNRSEIVPTFLTTAMGLLHGLGFSFVLHKIIQVDSPDIWQSLLAFNVGVEIGQLMIILAVWLACRLIQTLSDQAWRFSRIGTALLCIAIAAFWTAQRAMSVLETL